MKYGPPNQTPSTGCTPIHSSRSSEPEEMRAKRESGNFFTSSRSSFPEVCHQLHCVNVGCHTTSMPTTTTPSTNCSTARLTNRELVLLVQCDEPGQPTVTCYTGVDRKSSSPRTNLQVFVLVLGP